MEQIPLPSPVHYELLLQLLERQTMNAVHQNPNLRNQVNQLIVTLRKAAVQQKHLEQVCQVSSMEVSHRWSINHVNSGQIAASE
ncbi:MAG: DUF5340 domain-containing protein [Rivularia sp. (in: cyanobacteria)]|jgi:hypothetical protein